MYTIIVDSKLMRHLAKADPLDPGLQNLVWKFGDKYAKADLLKRKDLSLTITEQAILSDEYIYSWASEKDRDGTHVNIAIKNAKSENSFVQLLGQHNLDATGLDNIATWTLTNASKVLSLFTLERPLLPSATRRDLIQQYIILSRKDISAHFSEFNQISRKYLLTSKEDYLAALEIADWRESSLIANSNKFLKEDRQVLDQLLLKVAQLADLDAIALGSPMLQKDLKSVIRDILASSEVTESELENMLLNPVLSDFYKDLRKRKDDKSIIAYKKLTCNPNRSETLSPLESIEHVTVLESIVAQRLAINFPRFELAFEAIKHREALTPNTYEVLTGNILGDETRSLLTYLSTQNDFDSLLAFCRINGIHMTNHLPQRVSLLQSLASEGSKLISDHNLEDLELVEVLPFLKPVSFYLGEPKLFGLIAQKISELPEMELEFALTLIGQWESTLPELLITAEKVVGELR